MRAQEKEGKKDQKHIERLIKKKEKRSLLTPDLSHLDSTSTESILQPNSSGI